VYKGSKRWRFNSVELVETAMRVDQASQSFDVTHGIFREAIRNLISSLILLHHD
jgi:hypothetical protein